MTRVQVRPTAKTRKRRRRRRAITLLTYMVVVFVLAWYFESQGTTTVIFVRHADIDEPMTPNVDASLNAAGLARAERLADVLEQVDVDGGVNAIYVSAQKRTYQTALPLAKRLGLDPQVADHREIVEFMKTMLTEHKREIVLVVTHRDLIAPLVAELHGHQDIPEIGPDEYDNLVIVTIPWFGKVKTLKLPYGP